METKTILLHLLVSIIVAISITYLVIMYLPLIITGVLLIIVAIVIFSVILTVSWFVMQLVFLPYYALRQVKPDEEESKGGYRLEEVKEAKSEGTNQDFTKTEKPCCPQCGSDVQPETIFCLDCGTKLPKEKA